MKRGVSRDTTPWCTSSEDWRLIVGHGFRVEHFQKRFFCLSNYNILNQLRRPLHVDSD